MGKKTKIFNGVLIFAECVVIISIIVFYYLGYRLIPEENVTPDWEAINSVTSWVLPTMISGIAIWFSISVPKKIAEQQNKIALFEKKLEVYNLLRNLRTHIDSIPETIELDNNDTVQKEFYRYFGYRLLAKALKPEEGAMFKSQVFSETNSVIHKINSGVFLFNFSKELKGMYKLFAHKYYFFSHMTTWKDPKKFLETKEQLKKSYEILSEEVFPIMEYDLEIWR